MILRSRIDISLPPDKVWEMLRYAEYMELWNPKCVSCPSLGRELQVGDTFSATFKLTKEGVSDCEVLALEPCQRITIRHRPREMKGYVDETYHLLPRKNGQTTRVEQVLDVTHSSIPRWAQALMYFLNRFGRKMGDGPLEGLRDAAIAQAGMRSGQRGGYA
ncbi:SRPBCC family protein [Cerasicoccus arenae]|uniref:SRPBCC domain-containing protein n=1 Tax=Cerasicoccus arenae TaxID=424488 RepID=A0A8J3GF24_9BACT|nr:SRPBCC family protein [Cerasicoccus arenae]MBK1859557.1 SRPBCC family protein [Cerasicoccus arenae]GHC03137.1 hypothetical protein GCM10007047_19610 [Cerasicoccus arenae]